MQPIGVIGVSVSDVGGEPWYINQIGGHNELDTDIKLHDLQIDEEFKNLLPPLTLDEGAALEESLASEGCRDALIAWGYILVDGHNRYEICKRRGFPFNVKQMEFESREDVVIWICSNQNARRNITDEQRRYLLGKRYEAEKKVAHRPPKGARDAHLNDLQPGKTADQMMQDTGLNQATIRRAAQYARAVDTLSGDSPVIKAKLLSGEIKQPMKTIVDLAAQPACERKESVRKLEGGEPVNPIPETKQCTICGRTFALDRFYSNGNRISSECRQCRRVQKTTGVTDSIRENIGTITDITSAMYGNVDQPAYTIEDVLEEIERGADLFRQLVANTMTQHDALFKDQQSILKFNACLSCAADSINALRRM